MMTKHSLFYLILNFWRRGTAINDLVNPDRVLIGGKDKNAIEELSKIYRNWVPESKNINYKFME